jgi:hypothetical protein
MVLMLPHVMRHARRARAIAVRDRVRDRAGRDAPGTCAHVHRARAHGAPHQQMHEEHVERTSGDAAGATCHVIEY